MATALIQLYDLWSRGAEDKEFTAALLLDLSAAFDVVNHKILLQKLEVYNFSPSSLEWFKSYLEDRSQYVMVESKLSDPLKVGEQGVPQGSLLGPLCFIIFYNDFPTVREDGSSVLYADDDTDNISEADPEILKAKIQTEADLSTEWVSENKLVCSGEKTKLLIIGTPELKQSRITSKNLSFQITVAGHEVSETSSEKLLGMIINDKLTWSNHLYGNEQHEGLISKLSKRAGIIYKLSFMMPKDRLRNIAEGIFFSLLTYGIQVYGGVWGLDTFITSESRTKSFTKEDNNNLQIIMNKVLRSLTGLPRETPVRQLLQESGYLSVQQLTAYHTLSTMYKIMQNKEPVYIFNTILQSKHTVDRTRAPTQFQPRYNLSTSRQSFIYQAQKLFNLLPDNITSSENSAVFKKSVISWIKLKIPFMPP